MGSAVSASGAARSELAPCSHAVIRCRAQRPSSTDSARAPHRMSARRAPAAGARGRRRGRRRRRPRGPRRPPRARRRTRSRAVVDAQAPQAGRVAAVGDRGGHLEQRKVADDRAAQAPVQAAQRHQVDRGERRRGNAGPDRRRRSRRGRARPSRRRTAARGCARAAAAAVLVGLDLDQRGLRRAAQARDRPGVRVGLLELVGASGGSGTRGPGRTWRRARCGARRRVRRRRPRSRAGRRPSPRARGCASIGPVAARTALLEALFERLAEGEQRRRPLPAVVDAGQAAVVQLVGRGRARAAGPRRRAGRGRPGAGIGCEVMRGAGERGEESGGGVPRERGGSRACCRGDARRRAARSRGWARRRRRASARPRARPPAARCRRGAVGGCEPARVAASSLAQPRRLGGGREIGDERVEAARARVRSPVSQVGELGLHPVARRRPAVLFQPPGVGRGERLAGIEALGEVGGERLDSAATAAASSTVACASGTRTSSVP